MTACVGRERELAWITSRLEATGASGAAMVTVTGPPGVGKSRLLDELREQCRAAGFPVLEGWCVRHAAYAPFVSIAAQALAWLRARDAQDLLSPADLDALAPLVGARSQRATDDHGPDDDDEAAIRFTEAVARLLAAVARLRPVLVLLRGWSRADDATRALVRALLDAAGPSGEPTPGAPAVLLAAGIRATDLADPVDHPRVERFELEGLSPEGVRRILVTEAVVTRIHAATSGNPGAVLGMLERLPPPREAEIAARLDELGELPRRVLAVLSLADRPLPTHVLAAALAVDARTLTRAIPTLITASAAWRALDPAAGDVVVGMTRHDDGEAALARLAPGELPHLQEALGAALEAWGRASPEEALRHRLAGDRPADAAAETVTVARSLLRRHAPASALALAHLASPHASPATARELARVAASAAPSIAAHTEARAVVATAEAVAPDDPELARLDATLALGAGDWDGTAAALDRADARTRDDDAPQRAANAATRAELSYVRGQLDETERLAREAIALARDVDPVATRARNTMTKVFLARRQLDEGWEWSREGLERARARGAGTEILRGLINLGVVAIWRGDLDEAVRQLGEARAVADGAGSMMLRGVLRENEAVVAHLQGRYGDALQRYQEALGILTRVGNRRFLARVAHNLGELYVHVGEVARARRLCEYAAQVARGFTGPIAAEGLMLRARVELADARSEAARASLAQALGVFTAVGDVEQQAVARLLLARAALLDGDLPRAEAELAFVPDEAIAPTTRVERSLELAELARSRGGDAFPHARRALELAEATSDRDLRHRAHIAVGMALLDRDDAAAARRHAEFAEALRQEILGRVPESLRVSYGAQLARGGGALLATRLEGVGAAAPALRPRPVATVSHGGHGLIGESAVMRELRRRIARVAPQDVTVLLRGESGTGKERVAEALHQGSHRKGAALVKVNCAALGEGVLLSELFGHERGAFTGADRRRRGRFELADGGTIFLDEIGDVTPATQAALLRVLQERTFERVGGNETLKVDVRIITATNRDLAQMARDRTFREDLYFRLSSLTIQLPPLRERLEDLPMLAAHFLERDARDAAPKRLSAAALRRLSEHPWPGNVRELENVLRASALFSDGEEITPDELQGLPDLSRGPMTMPPASPAPPAAPERDEVDAVYDRIRHGGVSLFDMRREVERGCIARALDEAGGNITRAAALLGMKRPRLSQLVREYGLARGNDPTDTHES
jgi:DNA-binding NtrC family response regulator